MASIRAVVGVLLAVTAVACGAPEVDGEEKGSTESAVAGSTSYQAFIAKLDAKVENCQSLTASERAELNDADDALARLALSNTKLEIYGSISCTRGADGKFGSATITVEKRAGFSRDDGFFAEHAISTNAKVTVPLKLVDVSVGASREEVVSSTRGVSLTSSVTPSLEVSKDLGVVSATASVSGGADGGTIALNVSSRPLDLPVSLCGGGGTKTTLGVTIAVTLPGGFANLREEVARLKAWDDETKDTVRTFGAEQGREICCVERTCKG